VKGLAAAAGRAAASRGIPLIKAFRSRRVSIDGEPYHGPVQFLDPEDAHKLYRMLHRRAVLVLSFTRVLVRRDPSREPAIRKAALDLGVFVQHKARYELIRDPRALEAALVCFETGRTVTSCAGEDDPRCLPLHVFAVDRVWSTLNTQGGRDAFDGLHGTSRSRLDSEKKRWSRAERRAYHGREHLTVAGRELPPGMHWDVSSERGRKRMTTANAVWELPSGLRGYVNVYPDSYVRPGSAGAARRVWPRKRSASPT